MADDQESLDKKNEEVEVSDILDPDLKAGFGENDDLDFDLDDILGEATDSSDDPDIGDLVEKEAEQTFSPAEDVSDLLADDDDDMDFDLEELVFDEDDDDSAGPDVSIDLTDEAEQAEVVQIADSIMTEEESPGDEIDDDIDFELEEVVEEHDEVAESGPEDLLDVDEPVQSDPPTSSSLDETLVTIPEEKPVEEESIEEFDFDIDELPEKDDEPAGEVEVKPDAGEETLASLGFGEEMDSLDQGETVADEIAADIGVDHIESGLADFELDNAETPEASNAVGEEAAGDSVEPGDEADESSMDFDFDDLDLPDDLEITDESDESGGEIAIDKLPGLSDEGDDSSTDFDFEDVEIPKEGDQLEPEGEMDIPDEPEPPAPETEPETSLEAGAVEETPDIPSEEPPVEPVVEDEPALAGEPASEGESPAQVEAPSSMDMSGMEVVIQEAVRSAVAQTLEKMLPGLIAEAVGKEIEKIVALMEEDDE